MKSGFIKEIVKFLLIYFILSGFFFFIVKDDWTKKKISSEPLDKENLLVLHEGDSVFQTFKIESDLLEEIDFSINPIQEELNDSTIDLVLTVDGNLVWEEHGKLSDFVINDELIVLIGLNGYKGKEAVINIKGDEGLSFWYGNTRSAGKIAVQAGQNDRLKWNDNQLSGELVMRQEGELNLPYLAYFWPIVLLGGCFITGIMVWKSCCKRGKRFTVFGRSILLIKKYSFLMKMLVERDFKVKYKASALGVVWSLLNPLLMTVVYMFIFSTLFRSSIEHFVVYLMSGIVIFNFFSESTNLGMASIVGNAGLITKVYIPKYVFPVSKVLSSSINLAISMVPLLILMGLTGVGFSKSILLLPFVLCCVVVFCIGISLILSSALVFFRDTQFLWSVLLTVWNFMSPIFYPETIIPLHYRTLYRMNPLYHFLLFIRTILIDGSSPDPCTYVFCILFSLITLIIGYIIFKKGQRKFVFHL